MFLKYRILRGLQDVISEKEGKGTAGIGKGADREDGQQGF